MGALFRIAPPRYDCGRKALLNLRGVKLNQITPSSIFVILREALVLSLAKELSASLCHSRTHGNPASLLGQNGYLLASKCIVNVHLPSIFDMTMKLTMDER